MRGGEVAPEAPDGVRVHITDVRAAFDRVLVEAPEEVVVAERVLVAPLGVCQSGVDDSPHHPECERRVSPGERPDVLVGNPRRSAPVRVDDDEPRARAAGGEQEAPEVRCSRHGVPTPDEEVARVDPLLGIDLGRATVRHGDPGDAGARTDRPLESARADRIHDACAHRVVLKHPHCPEVAVRQHRLASEARDRALQAEGYRLERFVPARPPEAAATLFAFADERVEKAVLTVDTVEVVRHLPAEEAGGDRMLRVSLDLRRATLPVDGDEHRACVGAIVRTGGTDDALTGERLAHCSGTGRVAATASSWFAW